MINWKKIDENKIDEIDCLARLVMDIQMALACNWANEPITIERATEAMKSLQYLEKCAIYCRDNKVFN